MIFQYQTQKTLKLSFFKLILVKFSTHRDSFFGNPKMKKRKRNEKGSEVNKKRKWKKVALLQSSSFFFLTWFIIFEVEIELCIIYHKVDYSARFFSNCCYFGKLFGKTFWIFLFEFTNQNLEIVTKKNNYQNSRSEQNKI